MKQNYLLKTSCILLLWCVLFAGCSKRGCTENKAENYEPAATTDCGCCYFAAKGSIWIQQNYYNFLASQGVKGLKYYANGVFLRGPTNSLPEWRSGPPTVSPQDYEFSDLTNADVFVVNLGKSKARRMLIRVDSDQNEVMWQDSVMFNAVTVTHFELR